MISRPRSLHQSNMWIAKNIRKWGKPHSAAALAVGLAFSHSADGGGWNANASTLPPPRPEITQPASCPTPAENELTRFYTPEEAFDLSLKDGGQYVFVAGDDANMDLLHVHQESLRRDGYCVEIARVRSEGQAKNLRGVLLIEYGTAHMVQFNNREIATGDLGGTVMDLHRDNGR